MEGGPTMKSLEEAEIKGDFSKQDIKSRNILDSPILVLCGHNVPSKIIYKET
jgi:hypothetical protein